MSDDINDRVQILASTPWYSTGHGADGYCVYRTSPGAPKAANRECAVDHIDRIAGHPERRPEVLVRLNRELRVCIGYLEAEEQRLRRIRERMLLLADQQSA
jgi:hypothetical protein